MTVLISYRPQGLLAVYATSYIYIAMTQAAADLTSPCECYATLYWLIFLYEDRFIPVLVVNKADYMTDTVYITQISQIFVIISCFNPCSDPEFCQRGSNSELFFLIALKKVLTNAK